MRHTTLMSRGKKLFPGHTASPVPCGRIVFHGDEPSFTAERSFSVGTSTRIQATIRGSKWWERKVFGHSTLSGGILALGLLENLEFGTFPYGPALLARHSSIQHSSPNKGHTEKSK